MNKESISNLTLSAVVYYSPGNKQKKKMQKYIRCYLMSLTQFFSDSDAAAKLLQTVLSAINSIPSPGRNEDSSSGSNYE